LFLRDVVGVLAPDIGHNCTIRSFGGLFLRDVVGVLALGNSTANLRENIKRL
jgi:hypothetical protein